MITAAETAPPHGPEMDSLAAAGSDEPASEEAAAETAAETAAEEAADEIAWAMWQSEGWNKAADASVLAARRAGISIQQIAEAAGISETAAHEMEIRAMSAEGFGAAPPPERPRRPPVCRRPGLELSPAEEAPPTARQQAALRLAAGRRQLADWVIEGRDVRQSKAYDRVRKAEMLYAQHGGDPRDPAGLAAECGSAPILAQEAADEEEWSFW